MEQRLERRQRAAAALRYLDKVTPTTTWVTPLNIARHRRELTRRLAEGDRSPYGLPFTFPQPDLGPVARAVSDVRAVAAELAEPFKEMVSAEANDAWLYCEAISSRDDGRLRDWAQRDLPTPGLVEEARSLLLDTQNSSHRGPVVPAREAAGQVERALTNYALHDWSVHLAPNMAAKASVKRSTRQVQIRDGATFSRAEARRIVVHEIGGHVLRWANAEAQPEPLAARPMGRTIPTEEGLAVLLEEQLGVASSDNLRTYALRVVAVEAAQEMDLIELAFYLAVFVAGDVAAELALRIRRGFVAPGVPGGLTKDAGYLEGLLACRRLLAEDPKGLDLMRSHKWSLDHLPLARDLAGRGRLDPPRLVADLWTLGLEES